MACSTSSQLPMCYAFTLIYVEYSYKWFLHEAHSQLQELVQEKQDLYKKKIKQNFDKCVISLIATGRCIKSVWFFSVGGDLLANEFCFI